MEPADKVFDDTHDYFDDTGNKVQSHIVSSQAGVGIPFRRR
jgi:hypothetical protein